MSNIQLKQHTFGHDIFVFTVCMHAKHEIVKSYNICEQYFLLTVVLWSNMLGAIHWREDPLCRSGPNLPSHSSGEWAQTGKTKQCCMLWGNVRNVVQPIHIYPYVWTTASPWKKISLEVMHCTGHASCLISCAGVIGRWVLLFHAQSAIRWLSFPFVQLFEASWK